MSTLAQATSGCAGLCGDLTCVTGAAAGDPQECVTATADCTTACADGETCVAGVCRTDAADRIGDNWPLGASHPTALFLSDGRLAVVYYDAERTALVLNVDGTETILDGADASDRGMWANAVTDGTTIYVAYQDALGDQLYYATWSGSVGAIELVDDGLREGDRPHNVGAGAKIYLDNGTPKIAYQDALTADIELATRGAGGGWSHETIASGSLLDGFHMAATSNGPWLVWDSLDKNRMPVGDLEVREQP